MMSLIYQKLYGGTKVRFLAYFSVYFTRLRCAGLYWIGLDWIVLDCIGLFCNSDISSNMI